MVEGVEVSTDDVDPGRVVDSGIVVAVVAIALDTVVPSVVLVTEAAGSSPNPPDTMKPRAAPRTMTSATPKTIASMFRPPGILLLGHLRSRAAHSSRPKLVLQSS